MRDISLHLMDIAQNSISAGAGLVRIAIRDDGMGLRHITIEDDGCGMEEDFLRQVENPFTTSRTTRKVGLGVPLLSENARRTGGSFHIKSEKGKGTVIEAVFDTRSIDCIPLGNIRDTILTLVAANPFSPDFLFTYETPLGEAALDTRILRETLQEVPLDTPEVIAWMRASLDEEITQATGGVVE